MALRAWDSESGEAALTLNGLKPETEYAWYAVAGDEEIGYVKTDVYEFATKDTVMEIPDSNNPGNGAGNGNTDGSAEVPQTGGRDLLLPGCFAGHDRIGLLRTDSSEKETFRNQYKEMIV